MATSNNTTTTDPAIGDVKPTTEVVEPATTAGAVAAAGADTSAATTQPTTTVTDTTTTAAADAPGPGTTSPAPTPVTDKAARRTSGIRGFIQKLKPSGRKTSPSPSSSPVLSREASTGTNSHPGGIIPAAHAPEQGTAPVQPVDVRKRGGVMGEVDVLVTKEAEKIVNAMIAMVENSGKVGASVGEGDVPVGVRDTLYPHESTTHEMDLPSGVKWLENWGADYLDKIFVSHRMGVYVVTDRKTEAKIFETMPIFTRLGMHLLFVSVNHEILDLKVVEKFFADVSVRQGKIYDNADPKFVIPHIEAFVKTYSIDMSQLLEPNIRKYRTFNDFFSRQLAPSARPVSDANDVSIVTSPADCRLTVFPSVSAAKTFWIKGKEFSVATLLDDRHLAEEMGANPGVAVFRLAPQDYHRFHSPFEAVLGKQIHVAGTYYTVNPQAVNEDLNVFTANRRDVQVVEATVNGSGSPVKFVLVAVGAMLVGSIGWSKKTGEKVMKGEDLGYFQYGGSTVILIAPEGAVQWDEDLVKRSDNAKPLETLVRVGERIGKAGI